jgi:hypothetical protein
MRGNACGDCGRCASSKVQEDGGRRVSSGVRQSSDPGGGPELEADYELACGKLLGVLDEIQVLNRPTEVRVPEPAVMWEGGEDESALKDIRKQFAAQQVPAQLRSSFQPEPRHEASSAERPKEPIQGKVSGTPTIKTRESIMLAERGDFAVRERTLCATADEPRHQTRQLPECGQCSRRMRSENAGEPGKQPKWQRR